MHVSLKRLAATVALALTFVVLLSSNAFATHFRYGTLTWRYPVPTNRNRVEFKITLGFRRSYFSTTYGVTPQIGVALPAGSVGNLDITGPGYTNSIPISLVTESISLTDDWLIGDFTTTVDLPTGSATYTATYANCCRLSSLLDNNHDQNFILTTSVSTDPTQPLNTPPTLNLLPIIYTEPNVPLNLLIPSVDAEGDAVHFELAPLSDSGLVTQKPAGLTLNSNGLITWTPTNVGLYAIQIDGIDAKGAKTPLDFLFSVATPGIGTHPPTLTVNGAAPPTSLSAAIGFELHFTLTATDPDLGDTVTLTSGSLPAGATMTPSLPVDGIQTVSSDFRWTPSLGESGELLAFQATDNTGRAAYWLVPVNIAAAQVLYMSGIIRDFASTDADFAHADGDGASIRLVSTTLGPDSKPVFAPTGTSTTVAGSTSFNQWFNKAATTVYSIALSNFLSTDPGVFRFTNTSFLPQGDNAAGNYFTYEVHTYYTHAAGKVLQFSSSDDMWIYINGSLAVDLGGVHATPRTFTLNLDSAAATLGLTVGQTYRMDIFYAHRGAHPASIGLQATQVTLCDPLSSTATAFAPASMLTNGHALVVAGTPAKTRLVSKTDYGVVSGAAWTPSRLPVARGFEANFDFQITPQSAHGEGFAFVLQGSSPTARGGDGGNLGYASIDHSVAVEFDATQEAYLSDPPYQHIALHSLFDLPNSADESSSTGAQRGISIFDPNLSLDNGSVQHARVTWDAPLTPDGFGWIRVWLNQNLLPTMEAQISGAQFAAAFPDGAAWLGFTSGGTNTSEADVDISNFTLRVANPSMASAIVMPVDLVYGSTGEMTVQLRDSCNNALRTGGASFTAAMTTSGGGTTPVTIIDNSDGTYTFRYMPTAGVWSLAISLNGTAIINSPFTVNVLASSYVAPTMPTMTVTGGSFGYDGLAHPATVTVMGALHEPLGPVIVTYNGAVGLPVYPGSYAVAAGYAGNGTYLPASGTATITISGFGGPPCAAYTLPTTPVPMSALTRSGIATLKTGGVLSLIQSGNLYFSSSAWTPTTIPVALGFSAQFDFKITPGGEGLAFVIQSNSPTALGSSDGNLGFDFTHSLALEFDTTQELAFSDPNGNHIELHSVFGQPNSAGGVAVLSATTQPNPTAAGIQMGDGALHHVSIEYRRSASPPNSGVLTLWLDHSATVSGQWTILDLPLFNDVTQSGPAWVGFTSGSGGTSADVEVSNFQLGQAGFSAAKSALIAPPAAIAVNHTGSVTVQAYDVCGIPAHTSVPGPFTAQLTKGASTVPVTIVDNGDGTYTFSYTPPEVGIWSLAISNSGTPITNSPFSVTVTTAATSLSAINAPSFGLVNNALTASTTLSRADASPVGSGHSIVFTFTLPDSSTSVVTGTTDASGLASVTLPLTLRGNYSISAAFAGDSTLQAASSAGTTVPVYQRTSLTLPASLGGVAGSPVTFNVTLTTQPGGAGIVGQPVAVSFGGSGAPASQVVTTGAGGLATVVVVFPTAGSFTVQATFLDAAGFYTDHTGAFPAIAETASTAVTINAAMTTLSAVTAPSFAVVGNPLTVSTTLSRVDGIPVALGLPIVFTFTQPGGGTIQVAGTTDGTGLASVTFTPTLKGTHAVSAAFAANGALQAATSAPATISVYQRTSLTLPASLSGAAGATLTFTATLTTVPGGLPIVGEPVMVSFTGTGAPASQVVTTGPGGIAMVSVTFPIAGQFTAQASLLDAAAFFTDHTGAFPVITEAASTLVMINPAATTLSPVIAPVFGLVSNTLTASATLSRADGIPVGSGLPIAFTFTLPGGGTTVLVGTTDPTGLASVTFTPTLRGSHAVSAAFAASAALAAATTSVPATISVYQPTSLTLPAPLSGAAGATLTFTATLTTVPGGLPIVGEPVTVSFMGSGAPASQVLTTGPGGIVTVSVVFPTAGSFTVQATFLDAAAFYTDHTGAFPVIAETASTPVAINPATTSLAAMTAPSLGVVGNPLTVSTTLSRTDGIAVGAGLPIVFTFTQPGGGTIQVAGTTDGTGLASVTFTPTLKGTHTVSAAFASNATLAAATTPAPATISVYQPTSLTLPASLSGAAGATLTFTATLTTVPGGLPIVGEPVTVSFMGSGAPASQVLTTGPGGIVTVSVVFPTAGSFTAQATFLDASGFYADHTGAFPVITEAASTLVTINPAATTLSPVIAPVFGLVSNTLTASATLSRADGIPVGSGLPIAFTFTLPGGGTTVLTGNTDPTGLASVTFTPTLRGSHAVSAAFAANATLTAATTPAPATISVYQRTSLALPVSLSGTAGSTLTFNVTLTTLPGGAGLVGEPVTVSFTGSGAPASQVVTTGAGGLATVVVVFPTAGSFTVQATFLDAAGFYTDHTGAFPAIAETASTAVTINAAMTTLSAVTAPSFAVVGNPLTVSTTLSRPDGIAVGSGLPIVFTFTLPGGGMSAVTGTTNAAGFASASFTPTVSGTYSVSAAFAANATLAAATSAPAFTVAKYAPSFSSLTASQAISYGTPSIAVSGSIAASGHYPAAGEIVSVTIDGVSTSAIVGPNHTFAATIDTHAIPASPTPYVITYSYAGDGDFNATSDTSSTLTVTKAASTTTLTFEAGPYVYRGTAFTAAALATGAGGLNAAVTPIVYTGDCVNVTVPNGCTATAAFAGDGNYLPSGGSASVTITPIAASISVNGYSGVYDGNAHGATGTATGVGGANLNAFLHLGASFTNVPGGTAHWTFSGNANYTSPSGDVSIAITPATPGITVNGYSGVYDGNAHGATGSATGVGGANLNAFLNLGASFTNVPGGTAHWTFSGNANYTTANGDVQIDIHFGLSLLYDPTKVHQSGSNVPIKVELANAAGADISSAALVLHAVSVIRVSDNTSSVPQAPGNSQPGNNFTLGGSPLSYQFNLKTTGLAAGAYDLAFTVGSAPTIYKLRFQIR